MTERPILFNAEMVKAILDGRKTQTRRLVPEWQLPKFQPDNTGSDRLNWTATAQRGRWGFGAFGETEADCIAELSEYVTCPLGSRGDRLWVREAFGFEIRSVGGSPHEQLVFRASKPDAVRFRDCNGEGHPMKWKPSIHMPRRFSRITLEIVSVRVERLNDISESDAKAEGVSGFGNITDQLTGEIDREAVDVFEELWKSIYGAESWSANPWVWVIEFRRLPAPLGVQQ